jgi:photosystem II stability/assembly factor-like uncharacterized protein/outer membrane lipoprotein-sorting protein
MPNQIHMRLSFLTSILLFWPASVAWGQFQQQNSGVDVQLRGVSAVSATVAWASGANGTILRTVDGGKTWEKLTIKDTEKLDFRDIRAFDDQTAYVLSIGPGEQSRIYKTGDAGRHWQPQFTNHDPKAFYDCFAFWDRTHGIALSDSVDGKFPLLITGDGSTWSPLDPQKIPPALSNEGAFAASGTCIATYGTKDVWFATGGPAARVFHSSDQGKNWTATATPILSGQPPQGIFSVVFWDAKHGVVVGGDYMHPETTDRTAAFSSNAGESWLLSGKLPSGFRSGAAVAEDPACGNSAVKIIAVGTNGVDSSTDGSSWTKQSEQGYNAASFAGTTGWAAGSHGRIGRVDLSSAAAPSSDLEAVLKEMDRSSANFSTVQADFAWDNYQKVVDEKEQQTGKVYFRGNGKDGSKVEAIFVIASPAAKQVLVKPDDIQMYDLKVDQITEYHPGKNKADVNAFIGIGFGAPGHDLLKSYDVKLAGWETVDGTKTAKLQLTPLSCKIRSMFSQFVLWIDPQQDIPLKQQVFEPSGDDWLSHYSGFVLNQKISDDRFQIKKTPKTRVVTPGGK